MRARRLVTLVIALTTGLATASCASLPGADGPPDEPDAPGPTVSIDPVELVDLWRVGDADGETPDTWLRLDAGFYDLWRECGNVSGGWAASGDGLFVASEPDSAAGTCSEPWPTIDWLTAARAVEPADDGWHLLAADGSRVATLTIEGSPGPRPDATDLAVQPPELTDQVRAAFVEPDPLPVSLEPATRDSVLGRWVPVQGADGSDAHLQLDQDGTYAASDGCNGSAGAWVIGAGGRVLATSGPSTLIGCPGQPVGAWLAMAARAGLDGDVLVLLDRDGTELGRLARG